MQFLTCLTMTGLLLLLTISLVLISARNATVDQTQISEETCIFVTCRLFFDHCRFPVGEL
jgi:hypothetical protein